VFATTQLDRINLYSFVDNARAQRCFAACGFRPLSTARRFSPDIGEYDGIEMEITRDEFAKLDASVPFLRQPPISITQDAK
jgi:RimJ/RimL family protein N-acetyltransferase